MAALVKMNVLRNRIQELTRQIPVDADAEARAIARSILDYCDEECPEDSGALRSTGDVGSVDGGYSVTYGGGDVDYAVPVHNGHATASGSYVPANPWMLRGYRRAQGSVGKSLRSLRDALEK